ncbi:MAG: hypothetical protein R3Y29_07600 [bacterium]
MKLFKKIIHISMAITLSLTSLSGCNNSESTSNLQETIKITYWDAFCENMIPDSYCETLIESKFPIDIIVDRASNTNVNQVIQLLTRENVPDIFWTSEPSSLIESFGITREIPREMVEEYAPSFIKLFDASPAIYTTIMKPDSPDEFFALNGTAEQTSAVAGSLYADFFRYDWIEELGIDLGVNVTQISDNFYVADNGLTLDKFEEVMEAFTYGDPDGNGIDDTYGASFENMTRFDLLYSGFDMISGVNESNGRAEYFYATDNFKNFSIWFADLFSKGYFDEEFFYQDRASRWEKVNNEEVGYFLESSIAINSWASDRPPLTLIEKNPDATFLITPGLSNNDGQGTMIKNAIPTYGRLCYIGKDVDDETLILILQMLEYINFGEDNISLWFGEQGIDWDYDENGSVNNINNLAIAEKGSRVFTQNVMVGDLFQAISIEPIFAKGSDFWLYDCIWRENDREKYEYKIDLLKETNFDTTSLIYNDTCSLIYKKYFEDWVYNNLDVEESWERYMGDLDNAGYNIIMDELNKVEPLEKMILNFISN